VKAASNAVRDVASARQVRNVARARVRARANRDLPPARAMKDRVFAEEVKGGRLGLRSGTRLRVGGGLGRMRRGGKVRLVGATAARAGLGRRSVRLVARSAKVRTVVGRLVRADRQRVARRRAKCPKQRPRNGAKIRRPNIRTTRLRSNSWTMQLRAKGVIMRSSQAGAAVADAMSAVKKGSDFRKSSPALVLDHAAKSKIGFAPGESPLTVNRQFSACALGRPITCGLTAV
jgi:hypothetical protein